MKDLHSSHMQNGCLFLNRMAFFHSIFCQAEPPSPVQPTPRLIGKTMISRIFSVSREVQHESEFLPFKDEPCPYERDNNDPHTHPKGWPESIGLPRHQTSSPCEQLPWKVFTQTRD